MMGSMTGPVPESPVSADGAAADGRLDGTQLSVGDWAVEPVAIIGLSCRYPGGANTPSKLWANLAAGTSAWSQEPPDGRFNMAAFRDARHPSSSTTNANGGHFLSEPVSAFDAAFFGIPGVEAKAMDPQQRLLLEVAYESFENAGMTPARLSGSNTGVYAGQWTSDYAEVLARDPDHQATYHVTGVGPAITSNRISHFFNLHGPSTTVDTGCSASLVALHLAVQSLRCKETDMAFVGGVNILSDPQRFTYQSSLKMLSDAGRSYPFDHRAAGYGRGEGVAGVVLKTLSAALRDGDRVRAVIRNSVLNSDGRTDGIAVPNGQAQERAITKAYKEAGLELGSADYVEAHGTGTRVGDPIEVKAVAAVLGRPSAGKGEEGMQKGDVLTIGSVKGNIGHTESAAGLAGLIKAVLMLEKGCIPPQVGFEKANESLKLEEWGLRIPLTLEPRDLRRISVNSFGYGGTNAHVILDTARSLLSTQGDRTLPSGLPSAPRPRAFIVSGANENSFRAMAHNLASYTAETAVSVSDEQRFLDRLAITLDRRAIHRHKTVIISDNTAGLTERLHVLGETSVEPTSRLSKPKVAFVFSGQGAQYFNMGRELLDLWPVFTSSLHRANRHISLLGCDWDLVTELTRGSEESRVDEPRYGQPLSTAIQLALVDAITSLGLSPCAVAGHSSGEIAAAYAADYLSFEDAMTVSYHRGRLASALIARIMDKKGGMIAIGVASWVAEKYIASLGRLDAAKLTIACYNSPSSVTVSGDDDAILRLSEKLTADGVFNRVLRTSGAAYHSSWMRQIEHEYCEALDGITLLGSGDRTRVAMFSSLTGDGLGRADLEDNYWIKNLVSPVFFEDAVWNMCQPDQAGESTVDFILEIGPHSTLEGPVKQTIQSLHGAAKDIKYMPTLKRKTHAVETLLASLGRLYADGVVFDFHLANNGFDPQLPALLEDAPPYAFDHSQTYWHSTRVSKAYTNREFLPHELLNNLSPEAHRLEPCWRTFLDTDRVPWLLSHVIEGQIVFPAAGYLAMAIEAMRRYCKMTNPDAEIDQYRLRSVSFGNALVINPDVRDTEMCLSLRPEVRSAKGSSNSWMDFRVFTVNGSNFWTEHCRGLITAEATDDGDHLTLSVQQEMQRALRDSHTTVNPRKFYYASHEIGLQWQSPFDGVVAIKQGPDAAVYTVADKAGGLEDDAATQEDNRAGTYIIHPATLDAVLFHGLSSILVLKHGLASAAVPVFMQELLIPTNWKGQLNSPLTCYTNRTDDGVPAFDVTSTTTTSTTTDVTGEAVVLLARGVKVAQLPGDVQLQSAPRPMVHRMEWVTYCDALTQQHLDALCKSDLQPGSVQREADALNTVVTQHIRTALSQISPDQIPQGYRQHWFSWMQSLLAADPDNYPRPLAPFTLEETPLVRAAAVIGRNLPSILLGQTEPLTLLSEDDLLSSLYSDLRCQRCYAQMAAFCLEFSRQHPGMKVIEIGAGTGSASKPLLTALCGKDQGAAKLGRYDFTDISPAFFDAAAESLADFKDVVRFMTCDISRSVTAQGFEEGAYDLVVACNVLHATESVGGSLRRVRSLLKPGGVLLLMELTRDQAYYNLFFGSLPGWWTRYQEGGRFSPLLKKAEWQTELASHGFEAMENGFRDFEESAGGTIDVFVARADAARQTSVALPVELVRDVHREPELPGMLTSLRHGLGPHLVSAVDLSLPDSGNVISVFPPEICEALCAHADEALFSSFKSRVLSSKAILLLTQGATQSVSRPAGAMAIGFARTMRLELPSTRIITLDLDVNSNPQESYDAIAAVLRSPSFDLLTPPTQVETEFSEVAGQLFVPRAVPSVQGDDYIRTSTGDSAPKLLPFLDTDRVLSARLAIPGLLETLRWDDDDIHSPTQPLGPDEVELSLRAASVNFKDVLIAANQLEGTTEMRNDCAGVVTAVGSNMTSRFMVGDRVCAYYSRAYSNRPRVHGDCVAVIPHNLSFEEGASLPIVWGTVYYSLVDKGKLAAGDTVLIHSAAGAVGQAAIILARHIGASVFATVGSEEKKSFLTDTFGLPETHIFSSRTTAFGSAIRALTSGKGVDVVLNSLGGDVFRESCNVLASYGRFVEIGRREFLDDMLMPTKFLLRNVTFSYVDLALLIEERKDIVKRVLADVVALMASGKVRPTRIISMGINDIEAAFRLIQTWKHVGKVVLTVEEGQMVKIVPPRPPVAQLDAEGTYLVVGLGGVSRAVICWMGSRGARHIVAVSRSGLINAATAALIEELRVIGVELSVKRCDVASLVQVQTLIADIGPVRGFIHSAMVVEDALLSNSSFSQFLSVVSPKTSGTRNLYLSLPRSLDFFFLLSSVASICGNPGQSAYSAACAYQDSFAHFLRRQGLPAHSINVAVVTDVGYVAEEPEVAASLRRQGLGTLTIDQLLRHLDCLLAVPGAASGQSAVGLLPDQKIKQPPNWMRDAKFGHLFLSRWGGETTAGSNGNSDAGFTLGTEDVLGQVTSAVMTQLSKLLAIPANHLHEDRSLNDYGADSLVSVELRNWIGVYLRAKVPLVTLRNASLKELAMHVVRDSRLLGGAAEKGGS